MSATAVVPAISPAMGEISPASKNPTPLDARAAIPICVHPSSADALPMLRVNEKKCKAMAGIVDEGEEIIDETDKGSAQRDVGLIFAAQKAEHYEIATYGGLASLARTLGYNHVADLLEKTLLEEMQADEMLTYIAEHGINYAASQEPED